MTPEKPTPQVIAPASSEPTVTPPDFTMPTEVKQAIISHTMHRRNPLLNFIRHPFGIATGVFTLLLAGSILYFALPRSVTFSYSQPTCFSNPTILPNLVSKRASSTYRPNFQRSFSIGTYPVYSSTTCIEPIASPLKVPTETVRLGSIISKPIHIAAGTPPTLKSIPTSTKISTKGSLSFELTAPDKVFSYYVRVDSQTTRCDKNDRLLFCNVSAMNLAQATQYDFVLERSFKGRGPASLATTTATTVEPIMVTSTSIAADQTIYNVPTEITLAFNKKIGNAGTVQLHLLMGTATKEILTKASIKDNQLTLTLDGPLPRNAAFAITADALTAIDGAFLDKPFTLPFKTSGGPKVTGASVGSYKVQPNSTIILTLDSALLPNQNIRDFVRFESNNIALAAVVSAAGRTVTITPQNSLNRCTKFTVRLLDGIQNQFGVVGGSAWQFNSRTICQTTFSIGTSAQGRAITAYRFGSGASTVVYTGGLHGDEKSGAVILNQWIDELEMNYEKIPASRTIIVIPVTNPDGYAANRRTNNNNVDLNRNFPANNWKSSVTMPDKTVNPTGGGTAALSEPESLALANYLIDLNPRLVITYHATGGIVSPNDAGDSVALAKLYDQKSSGVYYTSSDIATNSIFEYDTTGALEDWLHDKRNVPAMIVELNSKTANEFGSHQSAMWTMASI